MKRKRDVQGTWLGEVDEGDPHVFKKADGHCKKPGIVGWAAIRTTKKPTLYAILVGGLDLCQDHFGRKRSEDGQPEDD
jgi:hypothetical protein